MGTPHDEQSQQHTVIATYRIKDPESEAGFVGVLRGHMKTLLALALVTEVPAQYFRQQDDQGQVTWVEIFTWRPGAVRVAHEHPEVAATWESMTDFLGPHGDLPAMSFHHYARVCP